MNNFTCKWINRLDQFGTTNITLLVKHNEGLIPDVRIEKKYRCKGNYESLDDVFFASESLKELDIIINEWNIINQINLK